MWVLIIFIYRCKELGYNLETRFDPQTVKNKSPVSKYKETSKTRTRPEGRRMNPSTAPTPGRSSGWAQGDGQRGRHQPKRRNSLRPVWDM